MKKYFAYFKQNIFYLIIVVKINCRKEKYYELEINKNVLIFKGVSKIDKLKKI